MSLQRQMAGEELEKVTAAGDYAIDYLNKQEGPVTVGNLVFEVTGKDDVDKG